MAGIKDVAELAGVSLSTASIVVNGKSKERKISEKTQVRVLDAMRELNYVPNVSAKTLRRGESNRYVVALFWSFDFRSTMMIRFLNGLQKSIKDENADMSIIIHPYQTGELIKEKESFLGGEFHAAIIANANSADLEFLSSENFVVPLVLYNRILDDYSSVNVDDEAIGKAAAEHLYHKGYRKPAVIHGLKNFPGATDREKSFIKTMKNYGIVMQKKDTILAENSVKGGAKCAENILTRQGEDLPDSFWCASDALAIGFANTMQQNGIRIPEDVGIIAVGNIDPQYSCYNNPPITVIDIPMEKMASGCFDYLKNSMHNYMAPPERRYFETELYQRKSTDK